MKDSSRLLVGFCSRDSRFLLPLLLITACLVAAKVLATSMAPPPQVRPGASAPGSRVQRTPAGGAAAPAVAPAAPTPPSSTDSK